VKLVTCALVALTALAPFSSVQAASAAKKAPAAPKVAPGNTLATISTSKGNIVLELYTKATPLTAGNFVKLAKKGFYTGQAFHRVVPGFVVQAGDPNSKAANARENPMIGSGGPGYTIKREASALKFKHNPGVIAMARTPDPDSAGSQWYITLAATPNLDGEYAVFGKVLKGMDVVMKIRQWDKINRITIGK
jgi:cyclophilin family peptidyl-prolyl cis-trans isomerase